MAADPVAEIRDRETEQPAAGLHTMQFGWGGETAEGFKHREENDCLRYHPTAATTIKTAPTAVTSALVRL